MKFCSTCGGAIPDPGVAYGFAGRYCQCKYLNKGEDMGLNLNPAPERREYSKIALGPETGRKIGYAEQALAEMEGEIVLTSDALDMLIRQLTPLINERPEPERAQAGASDRSGHSAHVEQIMGYTRRIAQMKERIQRTAALLEI